MADTPGKRTDIPSDAVPLVLYVPKDVYAAYVTEAKKIYTGIVSEDDAPKFALSAMVDSLARSTEFKTLVIPMIPRDVWTAWEQIASQSFVFVQSLGRDQLDATPESFKHFVAEVRANGRVTGEDLIALMLVGAQQGMLTMNHAPGVPSVNDGQLDFVQRFTSGDQRQKLADWLTRSGIKGKAASRKAKARKPARKVKK